MNRFFPIVSFALVAVASYVGCSSDDTTTKTPTTSNDAGSSGSDSGSGGNDSGGTPTDSGTTKDTGTVADTGADTGSSACAAYCQCMQTNCASLEPANCLTACQSQTTWDLACRTTHCGYATSASLATTHCPHAAGQNTCQ